MSTFEEVQNTYVAACDKLNDLYVEEKEKNYDLEKKIYNDNVMLQMLKKKVQEYNGENAELRLKNESLEKELGICGNAETLKEALDYLEAELKDKEEGLKILNYEHDDMMSKKENIDKNPDILKNIYELIGKLQRKKVSRPSEGGKDSQTANEETDDSSAGHQGPRPDDSKATSIVTDTDVSEELDADYSPQEPNSYVPQPANPDDLQGSPAYVPQGLNTEGSQKPDGDDSQGGTQAKRPADDKIEAN